MPATSTHKFLSLRVRSARLLRIHDTHHLFNWQRIHLNYCIRTLGSSYGGGGYTYEPNNYPRPAHGESGRRVYGANNSNFTNQFNPHELVAPLSLSPLSFSLKTGRRNYVMYKLSAFNKTTSNTYSSCSSQLKLKLKFNWWNVKLKRRLTRTRTTVSKPHLRLRYTAGYKNRIRYAVPNRRHIQYTQTHLQHDGY